MFIKIDLFSDPGHMYSYFIHRVFSFWSYPPPLLLPGVYISASSNPSVDSVTALQSNPVTGRYVGKNSPLLYGEERGVWTGRRCIYWPSVTFMRRVGGWGLLSARKGPVWHVYSSVFWLIVFILRGSSDNGESCFHCPPSRQITA